MRLKEKRLERGIEQTELAAQIGTNAPMVSNFENYKCLPVPPMLKAICETLQCLPAEIYNHDELYVDLGKVNRFLMVKGRQEPSVYKLSVRLPDSTRDKLTQENLEKCGYHSLKDFIWHAFIRFEKQLATIKSKENRPDRNSERQVEADSDTTT